jgi:hypothetical protein
MPNSIGEVAASKGAPRAIAGESRVDQCKAVNYQLSIDLILMNMLIKLRRFIDEDIHLPST